MIKNFFYPLILCIFFCGLDVAFGKGPCPEEWEDNAGHAAPPAVRKAADNLWDAVEREGVAAFRAGWSVKRQLDCGCKRGMFCLFSCGLTELCSAFKACCGYYNSDEFKWNENGSREIYYQRKKEVNEALQKFKEFVNGSTVRPAAYSGDANICEIEQWVEDGALTCPTWVANDGMLYSGRRDLSQVTQLTRKFVNEHGGWSVNYGSTGVSLSLSY